MKQIRLNRFVGDMVRDVSICMLLPLTGATAAWGIEGVEPDSMVGKCQAAVEQTFTGQVKGIWAKTEDRALNYEF